MNLRKYARNIVIAAGIASSIYGMHQIYKIDAHNSEVFHEVVRKNPRLLELKSRGYVELGSVDLAVKVNTGTVPQFVLLDDRYAEDWMIDDCSKRSSATKVERFTISAAAYSKEFTAMTCIKRD